MDNIILGLLLLQSRTIYQLRERIDKGLQLMYSSSMGSIQAAIKKLLRHEYIDYKETVENGKYKKIYSITDAGRQYFSEWINAPMEQQDAKNPELAKIYFMGFSDEKNRSKNIRKHLLYLQEQYHALQIICDEAENIAIFPEHKDILTYQLAAARYGRDFMKFNIEWYENLLSITEKQAF
ncbi:MAG: PadR family transcriptional regulator [Clostridium sp.]|nr:PadR family transcriptional regulator [Clostridium sp.]